nr:MAG TPA: hypothetical protein [Caudoviricetes sp.]
MPVVLYCFAENSFVAQLMIGVLLPSSAYMISL